MCKQKHSAELFCLGGAGYTLIEILWRNYTHWTMFLTGGLVFVGLQILEQDFSAYMRVVRCILGTAWVTGVEFLVGVSINLGLKLDVWDYSDEWCNLLGQVCPKYTLFWLILCVMIMPMASISAKHLAYLRQSRYNRDGKLTGKRWKQDADCAGYRKQSHTHRRSKWGRDSVCRLDCNG